jgi:hypothetical protein
MTNDKKRLRIGVLFGGRSGEHEVSLASAASVIRGLDPDKYEAVPIGISKEGHWLIGGAAQRLLPEVLKNGQRIVMAADPTDNALIPLDRSGSGMGQRLDVVFPVMHGTYGEDSPQSTVVSLQLKETARGNCVAGCIQLGTGTWNRSWRVTKGRSGTRVVGIAD